MRRARPKLRELDNRLYALVRLALIPLARGYVRTTVSGQENIPSPGRPGIMTVNHSSALDVLVVGYGVGRPAYFAAKAEVTRWPLVGPALLRLGAIPARRDRRDTDLVRLLMTALEHGSLVGLAPEGTRSLDGSVARYDPGFVWLAAHTGAEVIPSAIHGAHTLMPKGVKVPRRGKVWIRFGEPMRVAAAGERLGRQELADAAETVRLRTVELLADLAAESGVPSPAAKELDGPRSLGGESS